jgi:hypothetical protein
MAELKFPSDLNTYQQGHFMKINIYPSSGAPKPQSSTVDSGYSDTISLFVPGGQQNGPLQWQMIHEYDDVKLTRLGVGTVGAITRMVPGGDMIAGGASKIGGAALGAARVMGMGTINPKVDVLYGNSELRRFQFGFFMAPQSAAENDEMHRIIRTLRKYSAPALTLGGSSGQGSQLTSGYWFIPPAEFGIEFRTIATGSSQPNQYLPKIGRCVLERVDVDFTQQGEFSTFKDGAPTNLQLTLVFREMRIISQADIDSGY